MLCVLVFGWEYDGLNFLFSVDTVNFATINFNLHPVSFACVYEFFQSTCMYRHYISYCM